MFSKIQRLVCALEVLNIRPIARIDMLILILDRQSTDNVTNWQPRRYHRIVRSKLISMLEYRRVTNTSIGRRLTENVAKNNKICCVSERRHLLVGTTISPLLERYNMTLYNIFLSDMKFSKIITDSHSKDISLLNEWVSIYSRHCVCDIWTSIGSGVIRVVGRTGDWT